MATSAHTPRRASARSRLAATAGAVAVVLLVGSGAAACSTREPGPTPTSSASTGSTGSKASTVGTASSVLDLPTGAALDGVPYGIGKRIFLNGSSYDLAASWQRLTGQPGAEEFSDLDLVDGVVIWSIPLSAIDPLSSLGGFVPGQAPRSFAKVPSFPGIATTSSGFLAVGLDGVYGGTVDILTPAGTKYPPSYSSKHSMPSRVVSTSTGGQFVMADFDQRTHGYTSALLEPGHQPVPLPDNTFGAGRGTGWIATATGADTTCYRTAAVSSPTALRARICSQRVPMVSDDGSKAVVVQGNRVHVLDTRTGSQVAVTSAPSLAAWDSTHGYWLEQWLDANTYLVNVRDGSTLALLRCTASAGSCERVVTATVRTGVSRIVS